MLSLGCDVIGSLASPSDRKELVALSAVMNDQGTAAAAALLAATAMQEVGLEGGGGGSDLTGAAPDMTEVLSSLQTVSTPLGSVLTPAVFSDELSVMAAGGVSTDPESLRFQYPIDEPPTSKKKAAPTVYREQDRFLPINNVSRVMRNAIPKTGKVSKDAKECMQECVSEFVSFITSEAADRCSQEKRKTLTGDDILFAMATLGFDNYIQPMKLYLQKIRDYMKLEKGVPSGRERMTLPVGTSSLTDHTALDMQSLQSTSSLSPHFTTLTYDNTT